MKIYQTQLRQTKNKLNWAWGFQFPITHSNELNRFENLRICTQVACLFWFEIHRKWWVVGGCCLLRYFWRISIFKRDFNSIYQPDDRGIQGNQRIWPIYSWFLIYFRWINFKLLLSAFNLTSNMYVEFSKSIW